MITTVELAESEVLARVKGSERAAIDCSYPAPWGWNSDRRGSWNDGRRFNWMGLIGTIVMLALLWAVFSGRFSFWIFFPMMWWVFPMISRMFRQDSRDEQYEKRKHDDYDMYEKPKHDDAYQREPRYVLGDDGEIMEVIDEDERESTDQRRPSQML